MKRVYIENIKIDKVRHLENINIPVADSEMKHILITGKNGSGKTSLLDAIALFFEKYIVLLSQNHSNIPKMDIDRDYIINNITDNKELFELSLNQRRQDENLHDTIRAYYNALSAMTGKVFIKFNRRVNLYEDYANGEFVLAYYKADRTFTAEIPKHVEKVQLKDNYLVMDYPREDFIKYLVDLKMSEALAISGGNSHKADTIKEWFNNFEELLRRIFECDLLKMEFDEETFKFSIYMPQREAFDFNTLSSGYAAVLDIVVDIMMRMEKHTNKTFKFNIPGIVLIDEIETHLHIELQKNILELLTTIFPNIQFVVSTHSPFILNSLENAVIYDLENHTLVTNGLSDVPYEGIVEGYFKADTMSKMLREKYESYKKLVKKERLTDDDFEEIARLELFLNEIPDYLALDLTTEYKKLKLEFENRGDIV